MKKFYTVELLKVLKVVLHGTIRNDDLKLDVV